MPLAKRTDIINQILAMGVHPAFDCRVAKMSIDVIVNLTQSPETHAYIVRREFVEKMLEICEQRYKMVNERSSQTRQGKKEDPMVVGILKYVIPLPLNFPLLFLLSFSFFHTNIHISHTH